MIRHVFLTNLSSWLYATAAANPITLSPPCSVPDGAPPPVDPAFAGFAFEERSFFYYAGPAGRPNNFSRNLVNAITEKTETAPIIRVGGTSLDHSLGYDPNQDEAIVIPQDEQSAGIPQNMTFGPEYFGAFANFPEARYILNIPLPYENLSNSLLFAQAATEKIGNVFALELGNEINLYPGRVRPADWFVLEYDQEWVNWTHHIDKEAGQHMWQVGALSAEVTNALLPRSHPGEWSIRKILEQHLNEEASRIKSASIHYYQTKASPSSDLQADIMNHSAIVFGSKYIKETAEYLNKLNPPIPLALAEIGSSLGNKSDNSGLQNVLGSALWQADFLLYSMSVGVNKINSQLGVVFDFALWNVDFEDRRNNTVNAAFYGQILAAEFIGPSSNVQVTELNLDSDLMSSYASYHGGKLSRIAITNMEYWNQGAETRPRQHFFLDVGDAKSVTVKKLTSPGGADAKDGITWGGMRWRPETNGVGEQVLNDTKEIAVENGKVEVAVSAGEAVIVFINE